MDWSIIVTALISMISAIAVAYISRETKKSTDNSNSAIQKKFDEIERRLKDQESANFIQQTQLTSIRNELSENNLRTMRLDLLHAIETDPSNTIVILELAQKYFVDMKGNCYMSKVFQEWASDHGVNITSLFNQG